MSTRTDTLFPYTTLFRSNISPAERRQGDEAHPQLLQEFGGAYKGPQAAYVNRVGQNIAMQSGLSRSPSDFTVTLPNSPVHNAFAIPGGYVYVTRQPMALTIDEADMRSEERRVGKAGVSTCSSRGGPE